MLKYYLKLAWLSIRATPMLSTLMVLIIAIGIATSMVTYTVTYMMSKHPLESKAQTVLKIYLSSWNASRPYKEKNGQEVAPDVVSYQDFNNLYAINQNSGLIKAQTPIAAHKALINKPNQPKSDGKMRYMYTISNAFFSMFDTPFLYGAPWTNQSDSVGGHDVVISKRLNQVLFQGENSVGKQLLIGEHTFTIAGVLDTWNPTPKYFDYASYAYEMPHDLYVPFQTQINSELFLRPYFPIYCANFPEEVSFHVILQSECLWVSVWVELNNAKDQEAYTALLHDYDNQQKQLGRFPRPLHSSALTIEEHFALRDVIPEHSKMAVWLAFAFLAVCLLNCMSLLINKFHNKKGEIGLRRAVGASKHDIAYQFGCETALVGFIGGVCGLVLAQIGLISARYLFVFLNTSFIQMNALLISITLLLAVFSTCLFGLWPIYKAMHVQPSSQLKSL